jgi:hypothetical protein
MERLGRATWPVKPRGSGRAEWETAEIQHERGDKSPGVHAESKGDGHANELRDQGKSGANLFTAILQLATR